MWRAPQRTCASPGTAVFLMLTFACGTAPRPEAVTVDLFLGGDPRSGHHLGTSHLDSCFRGLVGPGSWGVQFTDWTGPRGGLRSLQLIVPALPDGRSRQFYLGVVLGDFFTGTVHEIETRAGVPERRGEGEVEVVGPNAEGTAAIRVRGLTADSVPVRSSITCRSVRTVSVP